MAVVVVAAAGVVAGCGTSHRSASTPTGANTIVIANFAFGPSTLTVAPGTKVTVRNADPATHTVTATGSSPAFDTGDIKQGSTVTFTAPTATGSYPYICQIHQFMHGTLQVR
jgi:plastocyanin